MEEDGYRSKKKKKKEVKGHELENSYFNRLLVFLLLRNTKCMLEPLASKLKAQKTKPRNNLPKSNKLYQIPTKLEEKELLLRRGCTVNEDHENLLFSLFYYIFFLITVVFIQRWRML